MRKNFGLCKFYIEIKNSKENLGTNHKILTCTFLLQILLNIEKSPQIIEKRSDD